MGSMKERGRCRHLVVAGCLPQRYGTTLQDEMPEVDLFVGTGEISHIVNLITQLEERDPTRSPVHIGHPSFLMTASHRRLLSTPPYTAYLKIAEGCSNCCSYCVIPLVRGAFRSRELEDLVREAEILAAQGVREIIITAQETTAYGRDLRGKPTLSLLLRNLAAVDGIRWIRVLYTHPIHITDDLLETIRDEEKICNYLDLPAQHIDDEILKSMNRRLTHRGMNRVIETVRRKIPGIALRTSLIVGYPGETEEKFETLLDFVQQTRFDHLGVFTYSREEGTPAAELRGQIPEEVKEERRTMIMDEQAAISYEINRSLIGSTMEVVIEESSDIPAFPLIGRARRQSPEIDGVTYITGSSAPVGSFITCTVTASDTYDLYADTVS